MDDDDDLVDLLSYQCPFTGKRRTADCEDGQLYQKHLGGMTWGLIGIIFYNYGG